MVVGTLELQLRIDGSYSLKDKRRVLRSILDRARNDFHVSIAEVDDQDLWNSAVLGVAVVSNDPIQAEAVLQTVIDMVDSRPEVEIEAAIRDMHRGS